MYLCFPVFLMLLLSTTLVAFQYFSSFAVFSSGGACAGTPEDEHNDRPSCSIHENFNLQKTKTKTRWKMNQMAEYHAQLIHNFLVFKFI